MKQNNKGFTLIEIMVTLVISSIILVVAGSIILNSFGYFDKTETANKDKYAVDKIAELVHGELAYASNVVVAKERPNDKDWHSLSLDKNGHLLKTDYIGTEITPVALYSKDFYSRRTLFIQARCYNNDYRMDISYSFLDYNNEQVYKTKNTLELINMKSPELTGKDTKSELHDITDASGYKIFYQNGGGQFINEAETEENDPSGTVADEIKCKDSTITPVGDTRSNNKGVWIKDIWTTQAKMYVKGDFVQYPDESGVWYRLQVATDPGAIDPSSSTNWKKIVMDFDNKSYYQYKDIIFFEGKYWQMIRKDGGASDVKPGDSGAYFVWDGPKDSASEFIISGSGVDTTPEYFSCNIPTYSGTVDNKDDHLTFEDIEIYKGNGYGSIGEFVRYDNYVWLTIQSGAGNISPGEKDNKKGFIWQRIELYWYAKSGYLEGDVIKYGDKFYKAKVDIFDGTSPTDAIKWKAATYENGSWK